MVWLAGWLAAACIHSHSHTHTPRIQRMQIKHRSVNQRTEKMQPSARMNASIYESVWGSGGTRCRFNEFPLSSLYHVNMPFCLLKFPTKAQHKFYVLSEWPLRHYGNHVSVYFWRNSNWVVVFFSFVIRIAWKMSIGRLTLVRIWHEKQHTKNDGAFGRNKIFQMPNACGGNRIRNSDMWIVNGKA